MEKEKCTAQSKQTGKRCGNSPAIGFKVCRFHGARGGAKTLEGRLRCKEVNVKHGLFTAEAIAERRAFNKVLKEHRKALHAL